LLPDDPHQRLQRRGIVDLQQGDYEEMDQLAIAKPLCKAAFRVLHAEDIGVGVARAIRAAVSGRPGGVYLDLPAKLFAQSMGAEVVKLEGTDVAATLCQFAVEHGVTLIVAGQSRRTWWQHITRGSVVDKLVNNTLDIDVLVVSFNDQRPGKSPRP